MAVLFAVAGISARFSLERRTPGHFLRERAGRLLVPFIGGIIMLQWVTGLISDLSFHTFPPVAWPFKYLLYLTAFGPLWFLLELFIVSLVLVLVRAVVHALDRSGRFQKACGSLGIIALLALVLPIWGASLILNTPVVTTLRNGFYGFLFLLGYFVFSQPRVLETLEKWRVLLAGSAIIVGIIDVWVFWGADFTSDPVLHSPLTNAFVWLMILGILGLSRHSPLMNSAPTPDGKGLRKYLVDREFGLYVVHYPLLVAMAFILITVLELPGWVAFVLLILVIWPVSLGFIELTRHIPVIRTLLYGKEQHTK